MGAQPPNAVPMPGLPASGYPVGTGAEKDKEAAIRVASGREGGG